MRPFTFTHKLRHSSAAARSCMALTETVDAYEARRALAASCTQSTLLNYEQVQELKVSARARVVNYF